jgi:hypothetical protein
MKMLRFLAVALIALAMTPLWSANAGGWASVELLSAPE